MSGILKSTYVSALISFAALARSGRMSDAVSFLGVSRQTIGRHMDYLDEHLGGPVIRASGRDHKVTQIGEAILGGAESLLQQAQAMSVVDGLVSLTSNGLQSVWLSSETSDFRGQQHPLWRIYDDAPDLIKEGFEAWKHSDHDHTSEVMRDILPHMLLFRRSPGGWICTHVGEQSAYAKWFGWEWAKSAVGSFAEDAISGNDYFRFCSVGYMDVLNSGTCRLDHHDIKRATKGHGEFEDIQYQRLTMSFVLPNKTPILGTLVCLSDQIEVAEKNIPSVGKIKL